PQRKQQRCGAGAEQASLQPQQIVTRGNKVHSGGAAAEGHEARAQAHLIHVVQIQVAVAQLDSGEHRVVLAVDSVRGNVQKAAQGAFLPEQLRRRLLAHEKFGVRQQGSHGLDFAEDVRRAVVRDSQNQRILIAARQFLFAKRKDRSAWRVGNGVVVAKVFVAAAQSVKREKMQRTMRYEDQVFGAKLVADGRN